ncbi:hypothetical protein [Natrinema sp. SYSU A 869]|uniref:hypothetical protein n=1 Tax=Natrinema sp. SYSU A 869 TaxID=2871694 RepID=UPI001CA3A28C|nr:hypothetical protein [Natrinema sp. SYSU A 869]
MNNGLNNACEVRNYDSKNDGTVSAAFGGTGDTAVGAEGVDCDPADNYTNIDVSDPIDGYRDTLVSEVIVSDLADAIKSDSCDEDSDDDWGWF